MGSTAIASNTGPALLPDVGTLEYNGVAFSSLYSSAVNGRAVKDAAARTVKYMEWTFTVEAMVTLPDGAPTIDASFAALRRQLSAQGGVFKYSGKGFGAPFNINVPGSPVRDVCWGPKPEVIDFTPLGGSRSAMLRWVVVVCLPEIIPNAGGQRTTLPPVLQFNSETSVTYDDEGYSGLTCRGTLEVPITRTPNQATRTLTYTVDDYRQRFLDAVAGTFDLTRFRITRRVFNVSRDKRTMEWDFAAEELPPMGLPFGATNARGTMSVTPTEKTMGLVKWWVTLRCTYTIRKDFPRRLAATAFYLLLAHRMKSATLGTFAPINNAGATVQQPGAALQPLLQWAGAGGLLGAGAGAAVQVGANMLANSPARPGTGKAFLMHFAFDEGLYLDSKTITFTAGWKLLTNMSSLLLATGVWEWYGGTVGGNMWATTMRDVQGWASWEQNRFDPASDVVVDFGNG